MKFKEKMSRKENILQRIKESEDCPICMNIIDIEEKVYTVPCYHVYCIRCMGKWSMYKTTCPMDRLNIEKVHVYNPIEENTKVVEITHIICKNICRDNEDVVKIFTEVLIRILSGCLENYNNVILMSNSLEYIYEIFTEESFQILLDKDPNDSMQEFNVFVQSIHSMNSEFRLKLNSFGDTIKENSKIISKKMTQIRDYRMEFDDNDELLTHQKDLQLLSNINIRLGTINELFEDINSSHRLSLNEQNTYDRCELRYFYEEVNFSIAHYREFILLYLNYVKSSILQLPKLPENIEYLDIFANTPETCLLCRNNKNENLVCKFDKCNHKICKDCEEMFDLRNIICPIENQLMRSRLISNPLDVEKIVINACEEMNIKWLESSFKLIEFVKKNYFKMVEFTVENRYKMWIGDHSRLCQLNVPTFSSIFYNEKLIWQKLVNTNLIYYSYFSSNADRISKELDRKIRKHFGFVGTCNNYWLLIWKIWQKWEDNYKSKHYRKYVIEELIKPSSLKEEWKEIEDKKIFAQFKRELENKTIFLFKRDQIEDKNGHVEKVLQSLHLLLTSGFD